MRWPTAGSRPWSRTAKARGGPPGSPRRWWRRPGSWTGRGCARPPSPPRPGCRRHRCATCCAPAPRAAGRRADGGEPALHEEAPSAPPAQEPPAGEPSAEEPGGRGPGGELPVLPDPVPRDAERALARFGLLGEGAAPVFTPGARYPLAGLLLALPALAGTGLLECARQVYGRLRDGYYGLDTVLTHLVLQALLREPPAEAATPVPPPPMGRVP